MILCFKACLPKDKVKGATRSGKWDAAIKAVESHENNVQTNNIERPMIGGKKR